MQSADFAARRVCVFAQFGMAGRRLSQDFRDQHRHAQFWPNGATPEGMRRYLYNDFILALMQELKIDKGTCGQFSGRLDDLGICRTFSDKVEKIILLDSAGFSFCATCDADQHGVAVRRLAGVTHLMPRKVLYAIVRTTYGDKSSIKPRSIVITIC